MSETKQKVKAKATPKTLEKKKEPKLPPIKRFVRSMKRRMSIPRRKSIPSSVSIGDVINTIRNSRRECVVVAAGPLSGKSTILKKFDTVTNGDELLACVSIKCDGHIDVETGKCESCGALFEMWASTANGVIKAKENGFKGVILTRNPAIADIIVSKKLKDIERNAKQVGAKLVEVRKRTKEFTDKIAERKDNGFTVVKSLEIALIAATESLHKPVKRKADSYFEAARVLFGIGRSIIGEIAAFTKKLKKDSGESEIGSMSPRVVSKSGADPHEFSVSLE